MIASDAKVGLRVRQQDWMLPNGHRDGSIVGLLEHAPGTPHRWLMVEFPAYGSSGTVHVRCSTAQLSPLKP